VPNYPETSVERIQLYTLLVYSKKPFGRDHLSLSLDLALQSYRS